ncbi:MAG: phosphoribosylglycinamide formyltransferase [Clostridiaceae bacterium]|jgi:phosphoribosylglycinamide formyltransferase-1|nr:phosphoribosylglycinamide formyltransferase [Clostridiaceae bacterium]
MTEKINRTKIAVLVSGGGTNLQALLDAAATGKIPHGEIVTVISDKAGAYALERAKNSGINAVLCDKKAFPSKEDFEAAVLDELTGAGAELIVLAGFLSILSEDFVKRYPRRIVNVHPSLIPSFCGDGFYGLRVHEAALARGVKLTGATVHFVDEITDGGEIIMQKAVRVLSGDTAEVLQKRVMKQAEHIILPKAVELTAKEISAKK